VQGWRDNDLATVSADIDGEVSDTSAVFESDGSAWVFVEPMFPMASNGADGSLREQGFSDEDGVRRIEVNHDEMDGSALDSAGM